MCVRSVAQLCLTLCNPMEPARLLCLCDFPGKNIGVVCHALLQGIFPTYGSNPCLLHWQVNNVLLSHLEASEQNCLNSKMSHLLRHIISVL